MNEEFNVVIAEDEKRICSLIKALIDWDGLHLRLVGEAHDGVQALTLLQQEKVDILITDIRMPGVNGLDLTKWVNDHCNQCAEQTDAGSCQRNRRRWKRRRKQRDRDHRYQRSKFNKT